MKAEEKVARQSISVLEFVESLGNVSEACRRLGMHRSQFYEYERRFQAHGLEEIKDLQPIPKSHPVPTPSCGTQIVEMSLAHPACGAVCGSLTNSSWRRVGQLPHDRTFSSSSAA